MPIILKKKASFFLADDVKEAITNREVSHVCLGVCACVHLGWWVLETMYGLMEGEEGSGSSHVGVMVEDK